MLKTKNFIINKLNYKELAQQMGYFAHVFQSRLQVLIEANLLILQIQVRQYQAGISVFFLS